MHKNATKCNETLSKWYKNKHGASKIMDTLETYQQLLSQLWHAEPPSHDHIYRPAHITESAMKFSVEKCIIGQNPFSSCALKSATPHSDDQIIESSIQQLSLEWGT
jgi:hypothetical protein